MDDVLCDTCAAVLVSVARVHARWGRVTVRDVQGDAALASAATVHKHLRDLRERGLVAWVDGKQGTLHPTVVVCEPPHVLVSVERR